MAIVLDTIIILEEVGVLVYEFTKGPAACVPNGLAYTANALALTKAPQGFSIT